MPFQVIFRENPNRIHSAESAGLGTVYPFHYSLAVGEPSDNLRRVFNQDHVSVPSDAACVDLALTGVEFDVGLAADRAALDLFGIGDHCHFRDYRSVIGLGCKLLEAGARRSWRSRFRTVGRLVAPVPARGARQQSAKAARCPAACGSPGGCFEGECLEVSGDGGAGLGIGGVAVDACQDDGRGFLRLVALDSNRQVIVAVSFVE